MTRARYRQWHWFNDQLILGLGYDLTEWSQVRLVLDVCPIHGHVWAEAGVFGLNLDLGWVSR